MAHCRITSLPSSNDVEIELLSYTEVPVDPALRSQVLRLCRPDVKSAATSMAEVCDLNFALGREFSRAVEESSVDLSEVDMIASHGQTLWHQPLGEHRSTLQMGEPAVIAALTRKYVFSRRNLLKSTSLPLSFCWSCFNNRILERLRPGSVWLSLLQGAKVLLLPGSSRHASFPTQR